MSAPYVNKTVEIQGLVSRGDLNGKQGFVTSFDAAKGRYLVRLSDGTALALKPSNLKKVSGADDDETSSSSPGGFGGGGMPNMAQYQAQVEALKRQILAAFPGMTMKQLGMALGGIFFAILFVFYQFGFLRGAWTLLFIAVGSSIVPGAVQAFQRGGASAALDHVGSIVARKIGSATFMRIPPKAAAMLPLAVYAIVFAYVLGPSSARSSLGHRTTASSLGGGEGISKEVIEKYYQIGYEDGQLKRAFGASLPSISNDDDDYDDGDYPPQHSRRSVSSSSSSFGMGSIITILMLGKTVYDLGRGGGGGGWNPQLAALNFQRLPTWRKLLLGMLLLRIVGLSPI